MALKTNETAEQEALFQWAEMLSGKYPELGLMYHIPNEGERSKTKGAEMKRAGLKPGVPDICLPVARGGFHSLYIELKVDQNKPSKEQREWIEKLQRAGHLAAFCWGWSEAATLIEGYLKGGIECGIEKGTVSELLS